MIILLSLIVFGSFSVAMENPQRLGKRKDPPTDSKNEGNQMKMRGSEGPQRETPGPEREGPGLQQRRAVAALIIKVR